MPEETPSLEPSSPSGEHPELAPLENRLAPEQIAELDKMNAFFLGGQSSEELAPEPPAVEPVAPKPPAPPKPPVPPKPPKEPVPPTDGILPPEPAEPPPGDTPPAEETPPAADGELPEGKAIVTDEDMAKFRTEKAKKDVGVLRQNYDTARLQVKALTDRVAELEKSGGGQVEEVQNQLKEVLERNAQLSAIVERKAIREHPSVRKQFIEPREAALARAEKHLELAKLDSKQLGKILELPDEQRIEELDKLYASIESPTLLSKLQSAVAEIDRHDDQLAAFLSDRESNIARLTKEEERARVQAIAEQSKQFSANIDAAFNHLAKKNEFFQKSGKPEHSKWDADLEQDLKDTKEFLLTNEDPSKLLAVGVAASRFTRVYAAYQHVRSENADLRAQIKELRGGKPSLTPGDPGGAGGSNGAEPPPPTGGFRSLVEAGRAAIQQVQSEN